MNKQFFICWLVIFIAWMLGSFLVHGLLLQGDYSQLPNLFRPEEEAQRYFHFMLLAHIIMAGAFVWIYQRGVNDSPWLGQGVRYGIAIACLAVIPTYMIYYVVQPMPGMHVIKQTVFDGLLVVVLGIIVALLCKPKN